MWLDISLCRIYYKLDKIILERRSIYFQCFNTITQCQWNLNLRKGYLIERISGNMVSFWLELQKNSLNPSVDSVSALSAFGKHPLFHKPPQSVLHLKVSELSELAQYL